METTSGASSPQIETRREAERDAGPRSSKLWHQELALADKTEKAWRERGRQVVSIYRGAAGSITHAGFASERTGNTRATPVRFNILWSNTEILKAGLFTRLPEPDVRRRYRREDEEQDRVMREVAEVLERGISWTNDVNEIGAPIEGAVEDELLPGRGVVRLFYNASIGMDPTTGTEKVIDQSLRTKYWYWEDYRESPARNWASVRWVAFRHYMTRDHLVREFPEHGAAVPLDAMVTMHSDTLDDPADAFKRAAVWEIWDKARRQRHWIAENYDFILETEPDPYNLVDFFPLPDPLYSVQTSSTRVPVPEFTIYQKLADELEEVTVRATNLVRAMKRRGAYDARFKDVLNQISDGADNYFAPVEDWQGMMEKGGLAGVFSSEDLQPFVRALEAVVVQRERIINMIYEITGISDIMRGDTKPSETATAQQIKARFGTLRFQKRQDRVAKFVRDIYRLEAEIIAEKFTVETLETITGKTVTPAMEQVLRSDRLRSFGVDVQSDETALQESEVEKRQRVEFLGAVTPYLEQAMVIANQQPLFTDMLFDFLEFGMRGFKVSRSLEESVAAARAKVQAQQQQQGPANAQQTEAMMKMQADMQKLQLEFQKLQAETAQKQEELRLKDKDITLEDERERLKMGVETTLRVADQDLNAVERGTTVQ